MLVTFAVASNDTLYGSDPKFFAEVNRVCGIVVEEILSQLRALDDRTTYNKQVLFSPLFVAMFLILTLLQASLSLELFERIITFTDINHQISLSYAGKLWDLSHRHTKQDPKVIVRFFTIKFKKKS